VGIRVNWVKYLELPLIEEEHAFGTCLFGDYVAVVGHGPFVVLLNRNDGDVERKWRSEGIGGFDNCLSVNDRLYAVGHTFERGLQELKRISRSWLRPFRVGHTFERGLQERELCISMFDSELRVLKRIEDPGKWFSSIAYDGKYLYIGGYKMNIYGERGSGYIEKRTLDLEFIKSKEVHVRGFILYVRDFIHDVAVNPATSNVWAVGYYRGAREIHSLIVVFDRELNEVRRIDYPESHENYLGNLAGICFDDMGNAYVVGDGVAKLDSDGNLVAVRKGVGGSKVICVGNLVYVFGEEKVGNYKRHTLYVLDSKLEVIERHVLNKDLDANSWFMHGRPSFDGRNIYVAGHLVGRSLIYSIAIEPSTARTEAIMPAAEAVTISAVPAVTEPSVPAFSYNYIRPFLSHPLSGLVSGYGCAPSREVVLWGLKYKCCKLGAGGWGVVYLCKRKGERIAVKMPFSAETMFLEYEKPTLMTAESERPTEEPVLRELDVLRSLDHPHILRLLDVRGPFLIYEYAQHGSLAWQMARGYEPSAKDLLFLAVQIGDALRYVHSRGIVHGDVKPSNILLVNKVAKLGDFSSAKLVARDRSLSIASTYGYRAPEQVDRNLKRKVKELGLENRVDVYQLGSTLLHLATGESLDGEDATEEEVSKRTGGVEDKKLAALLREVLSVDPTERLSAEDVVRKACIALKKTG